MLILSRNALAAGNDRYEHHKLKHSGHCAHHRIVSARLGVPNDPKSTSRGRAVHRVRSIGGIGLGTVACTRHRLGGSRYRCRSYGSAVTGFPARRTQRFFCRGEGYRVRLELNRSERNAHYPKRRTGHCLRIGLYLRAQSCRPERLANEVLVNLQLIGASNPVTAVLLNFRAYDTLLELAVLLLAVLGVLALGPARPGYAASGPVLLGLTRWLVPLLILVSAYLLWVGAHAPGGAFQAGALLAAAGVLLRLAGYPTGGLPQGIVLRSLSVVGVTVFLAVGLTLMLAGRPFLGYPVAWAGGLILAIETAATLGIAVTLIISFLCGEPDQWTVKHNTNRIDRAPTQNNLEDTHSCSQNK